MWSFGRSSFFPRAPPRWWRASVTGDGGLGHRPELRPPTGPTPATAVLHSTTRHRPVPLRWAMEWLSEWVSWRVSESVDGWVYEWMSEWMFVGFVFAGLSLALSFPFCPSQPSTSWHQETTFFVPFYSCVFISLWFFICSLILVHVYGPLFVFLCPLCRLWSLHANVLWFAIVPHRPNT